MSDQVSSFQRMTDTIDAYRKTANFAKTVEYLKTNVSSFIDKKLTTAKGSERKMWEQSHNLVVSFVEGARTNDVNREHLKTLSAELKMVEKAHEERVFRMSESAKAAALAKSELEEFGETAGDKPFGNMLHDPGLGMDKVFDKYKHFESKLPNDTKKPFVAIRMPIAVISKGIPDPVKLKRTGLCDDLLFGYPILKNQIVVGFNWKYLRKYIPNWEQFKKQEKNNLPITVSLNANWQQISDFMAEMLKERTGKNYVLLGKSHKHGELIWAWMAESRELQRLNGTTGTATFSVSDWAFPFSLSEKT
jgi:hypothetical protein